MAIARTQAVSANATNVAISSTSANDVIIVLAYNNASTTIPTLPAGFNSVDTQAVGGSANACRVGWKLSAGSDTSSGTWTNATNVVCHVYSGLNTSTPIGGHTPTAGSSTTLTYGALSMTVASGSSWVVGLGAAKSATAGMTGNTTLLTKRTNQTTVAGLDSGAGLTAYAGETLAFTTTSRWVTETLELLAAPITIVATDTQDTAAVVAANWTTAGIAATDGADVAAVAGRVTTGGSIGATDGRDVAAVNVATAMTLPLYGLMGGPLMATAIQGGTLYPPLATLTATVAATDGPDTAALATTVTTGGAIGATDAGDTAAVVAANWTTAQIAAIDGADIAAAATSVTTAAGIAGTDGADSAVIAAANWTNAAIAASDAPDACAIVADAGSLTANIAATDAVDQASIAAANWTTAILAAIDAGDLALVEATVPDSGSGDSGWIVRARRRGRR